VLSGRLKAVFVATLATIILIGVLGPAATLAADPPGLARFMIAVGRVESGGNYDARNPSSGATGKYQIMPSNWGAWARMYLGNANASWSPANQDAVAAGKFRSLYRWLGTWRRVAYWWLTGSDRTTGWSPAATRYVAKVMALYNGSSTPLAAPVVTAPVVTAPVDSAPVAKSAIGRVQETNARIAYTGTWRHASHQGYRGGGAQYSTAAGATASFTFTGTKVVWYGPLGPTRGQAKVSVDGVYVKTVNLTRNTFRARAAVFTAGWATAAAHTLTIEVVGTKGHPYVAIDELIVTD
jgi:hypothetical protein